MREALDWIKDIAIAIIIAVVILSFFKPIIIQQESMQPNFFSGDYVVVSRQAYTLFGDVEHGDVIVFRSNLLDEEGNPKHLIKRIIGIPGDTIEIVDGTVIRNGERLDESYISEKGMSGEMSPIIVEEGKLFVMGDNRGVSQDSRSQTIGQVNQETIVGKVVIRIFPFNRFKLFP